ncbi:DNA binding protein [Microbacterium phage Hendrix]|uniref:DNA binding protein n=1 Tax=Microbacterium phage Hendrix TaxID=2182341 RepID=A0A2U8UUJ2_9CAUD|nr:DNA binding protein [Microbacterium phage Hendrix]AWN07789.1 DNA binding protein [Microbacterium phage Hendrix]
MTAKRYICNIDGCTKEFHDDRGLGIHRASHLGQKEKCPRCGKQVKYLDTHMRRVHTEDPEKVLESITSLFVELELARQTITELRQQLIEARQHHTDTP